MDCLDPPPNRLGRSLRGLRAAGGTVTSLDTAGPPGGPPRWVREAVCFS